MSFYKQLRESLSNKFSEKDLELLPRSYSVLGKLMIIRLKPRLLKRRKLIGKEIRRLFPHIDAVFLEKSIEGVARKPRIELLAGGKRHSGPVTQTLHREHGCSFLLDVSEVMWSKGNKEERDRLSKMVKRGEAVVDMFAGIGYWTIPIAKNASPKTVYAIELNPKSAEFLEKNVWLNRVEDRVEILQGDCRKYAGMLVGIADRVIMGYLYGTEKFLPYARAMAKKNATIHFHTIARDEKEAKRKVRGFKAVSIRKIKSYAPKVWHFVLDLKT